MTGTDDFLVPVKTWLRPPLYRLLHVAAERNNTTVEALVAECVRRVLVKERRKLKRGTPGKPLTTETQAEIVRLHGLRLNDADIARQLGLNHSTVHHYRAQILHLPALLRGRPPRKPVA